LWRKYRHLYEVGPAAWRSKSSGYLTGSRKSGLSPPKPCDRNSARQGRCFRGGVWDRDDKLFLVNDVANPGGDHLVESPNSEKGTWVPLTTIDKIVADLKLQRVDFIKMDIEGAEQKALMGAAETIRRWRPRMGIGTEHTSDLLANSMEVLRIVRMFNSGYQYRCGYCGLTPSARWGGVVLTPVSLDIE
jgi:FkbM family methyltransferase